MSKRTVRELGELMRQEAAVRLTPHDAQRLAELRQNLIGPAVQQALERSRPQIDAAAAALTARQRQAAARAAGKRRWVVPLERNR